MTVSEQKTIDDLTYKAIPPLPNILNNNEKNLSLPEKELEFISIKDEDPTNIALKYNFIKPTLANTHLRTSVKPIQIASPETYIKLNIQKQKINEQNNTKLKNTVIPPDAVSNGKGHLVYKLPQGTFTGGFGAVSMIAVQRDGSPLPQWIKFDGVTGKIIADVPKNISQPIEIKIKATDSKGDQAETTVKIKVNSDKVSFIGKKSLSSQLKDAFALVA